MCRSHELRAAACCWRATTCLACSIADVCVWVSNYPHRSWTMCIRVTNYVTHILYIVGDSFTNILHMRDSYTWLITHTEVATHTPTFSTMTDTPVFWFMTHKHQYCDSWLMHTNILTHDSYTNIVTPDMTRLYVCHDSFIRVIDSSLRVIDIFKCVTWLIHVFYTTHACALHDSFIFVTLIFFKCNTWLTYACVVTTHSCQTYAWAMSHIRMSHVTRVHESCHTCGWVMSHI